MKEKLILECPKCQSKMIRTTKSKRCCIKCGYENTEKKEFELQEIKPEPPKKSLEDIRRERKRLEEELERIRRRN